MEVKAKQEKKKRSKSVKVESLKAMDDPVGDGHWEAIAIAIAIAVRFSTQIWFLTCELCVSMPLLLLLLFEM